MSSLKKDYRPFYVTSLNIPASLKTVCHVKQLALPLITFQIVVPVERGSHRRRLQAERDALICFLLCHIVFIYVCVMCEHDEKMFAERWKGNTGAIDETERGASVYP